MAKWRCVYNLYIPIIKTGWLNIFKLFQRFTTDSRPILNVIYFSLQSLPHRLIFYLQEQYLSGYIKYQKIYLGIILFIISIILQGCGGNRTYLKSTAEQLQKDYKLNHGAVIVSYDLAKLNKDSCIFAKDFGRIVNEAQYNKYFLRKFKRYSRNNINKQSAIKLAKTKNLLMNLDNKYQFLTHEQLYHVNKQNSSNSLSDLAKLDKTISSIPIMIPESNIRITSHYGMRKHPRKKCQKFHCGTDLISYKASPVYAAAEGRIINVGNKNHYGNLVEIKHSNKFITKYAHLRKIYVKTGEHVIRGQLIGLQGNTGNATGEHLHFEILLNNRPINPIDFISHACNC
ncbi:MAG: M23 family metallopeptidase [Candidatus Rickettsia vulgarisii]